MVHPSSQSSSSPRSRSLTPTLLVYGFASLAFAVMSVPLALRLTGAGRWGVLTLGALLLVIGVLTLRRHRLAPLSFLGFAVAMLLLGIVSLISRGPTKNGFLLLASAAITAPGYLVLRSELAATREPSAGGRPGAPTDGPAGEPTTGAPTTHEPRLTAGPAAGKTTMNLEIHEDCRSLSEFYPDETQRWQLHYAFAHRFFTTYFFSNPRGVVREIEDTDEESTRYVQARWQMMEHEFGLVEHLGFEMPRATFRRVTDLSAWKQLVGDRPALCVEMPVPEQSPHAYFLALVLLEQPTSSDDEIGRPGSGRFFTLERTVKSGAVVPIGDPAILCEWTPDGAHRNLSTLVAPTRDAFVDAVAHKLDVPRRPVQGS